MATKLRRAVSLCISFLALPLSAATIVHDYDLTNSLNDLIGSNPLTADGGTINVGSGYSFGADQGLTVSSELANVGNYSILVDFSFDSIEGYRKILDFKNLASDDGLYNLSTDINYYNVSFSPNGAFVAGTPARVVLTRDATTQEVFGYVDGVVEIGFTDASNDATFSAADGIMHFFEDDTVTGGREASSGIATQISIYDGALTSDEVAQLGGPESPSVPEPGSAVLLGLGLVVAFRFSKRSSKPSATFPQWHLYERCRKNAN